jgi:hypothetical protein
MAVELRALGKFWGELSDDGRYLELRRHDCRVARVDLVESARAGRTVLVRVRSEGEEGAGVSRETGGAV